ncbi:uncharacterized protein TA12150 [Theileria annulata]|uniref:Uncharacterized protein n=1 Tax=Theileria annulata TaxID=5874 RepID=Q4UDV6_THEAN|nr:uncharacterized protein TA12150 [Theileria annulata]CAI74733.1 hypothetical protein TA12150 [Theileria annulata]|eukprot:XP_952465.1 hypothetical protein TA12150 [Theileria annulata]
MRNYLMRNAYRQAVQFFGTEHYRKAFRCTPIISILQADYRSRRNPISLRLSTIEELRDVLRIRNINPNSITESFSSISTIDSSFLEESFWRCLDNYQCMVPLLQQFSWLNLRIHRTITELESHLSSFFFPNPDISFVLLLFDVDQEQKLCRELKSICRNSINDIKVKIDIAKSTIKNERKDRGIPSIKAKLTKYKVDILNISNKGRESIRVIENHLSKKKEYIMRKEELIKNNTSKKNLEEFKEYIEELIKKVEKFSKNKKKDLVENF